MTKPLSWNEIKSRALKFSKTWADASNEDSEAKPFLIDFFEIFGMTNKRLATFEHAVKKYGGKQGFVDLFWPGILLIEMKSRGRDLTRAYDQAMGYFDGIKESDLPRYILVSDFARFALTDLETNQTIEFKLEDLHKEVKNFGFIAGYTTQIIVAQDPINIKAAERMGKLHDSLKAIGYDGHALELYLVRLLFCLFAEDTSIYHKRQFQDYIENRTAQDGSDLAHHLSTLFYILNTTEDKRLRNLDEDLAAFPYVNGKLFAEPLPPASFDSAMRDALLDACALDWSRISPAIFGSLFQSIMDKEARRNLGAHYTSEENIQKLIKPLFLDALWDEFNRIHKNPAKLNEFHERLARMSFFDPACGCGNFLVITYRELRKLELEILKKLHKTDQLLEIDTLTKLNVNQFYGIEIEEFPAQIAQVALWLTDHQMNQQTSEVFGAYFARIPLTHSATIVHGNALQIDWNEVCPNASYIIGNPPFIGHQWRSAAQQKDVEAVFPRDAKFGKVDFVGAWFVKATRYMCTHPSTATALVSTNSITQGEQVGILWGWMLAQGVKISFAHRTFSWTNEARGKAAVHVVIIGFALRDSSNKTLYLYDDIKGEPHAVSAHNINPYLLDAPDIVLPSRSKPPKDMPAMTKGSQPTDGGHLICDASQRTELLAKHPDLEPFIKPFMGGYELLNGGERYCLWFADASAAQLKKFIQYPDIKVRIEGVKKIRLESPTASVQAQANEPFLFTQNRQPRSTFLAVPEVSSERRQYIPIGFLTADVVPSNLIYMIPNVGVYEFGVLISSLHMAWMRTLAGRMKSDFRYSPNIYQLFPWIMRDERPTVQIEQCAQVVLDVRAECFAQDASNTLASLYDPDTMPKKLREAHAKLDKAVDTAYGFKSQGGGANDAERVAFLFALYQKLQGELTQLAAEKPKAKTRKGKNT